MTGPTFYDIRTTRRSEVCESRATCCGWPAQAYCNTLEAATLAHIGKGVTL